MKNMSRVEESRLDLGYCVRPTGVRAYVRTYLPISKIGSIWLPPTITNFYYGPSTDKVIKATVLSVGNKVKELEPGDEVLFTRLFFMRHTISKDGSFYGWVDERNVIGIPDGDVTFVGSFRGGISMVA